MKNCCQQDLTRSQQCGVRALIPQLMGRRLTVKPFIFSSPTIKINVPRCQKMHIQIFAPSEDSDQPAHSRNEDSEQTIRMQRLS